MVEKRRAIQYQPLLLGGLVISLIFNVILGIRQFSNNNQSSEITTVTNIVDGDTVDTKSGIRVRLLGLNSPEYPEGCLSKRAKERLSELVLGKVIRLEILEKDRFGRSIAWVTTENDLPVSIVMAEEGLGVAEDITGERGRLLIEAQNRAQETKRGIWSSECTSEREGCVIKGNYHKGTKQRVYHLPDCYNYNQININPNESDRWYCTEAEAQAAGFTKSKDCPGEK